MTDKLMYIPNDDTQNYPFSRLQLLVQTFGHSTKCVQMYFNKSYKDVELTNKKTLLYDFGDQCNKQSNVQNKLPINE